MDLAHPLAEPGQDSAPDRRADDRNQAEDPETHPHQTGGNADQMADHRQQAGEEDAAGLVAFQPDFRPVQLFLGDEHVPAKASDEWPAVPWPPF